MFLSFHRPHDSHVTAFFYPAKVGCTVDAGDDNNDDDDDDGDDDDDAKVMMTMVMMTMVMTTKVMMTMVMLWRRWRRVIIPSLQWRS